MNKSKFQIFVENFILTGLTILKILLFSKFFNNKYKAIRNKGKECIILGNGPSLSSFLTKKINFLKDKDSFAVNFFWKSEYFEVVKPKYYVILSTNYWTNGKIDLNDEGRKETFNNIARKTYWNMILFVPIIARKDKAWRKELDLNKNISIEYLNITPVEGFEEFSFFCFKKNLGMPRPHNVLVACVKASIDLKYENVFVAGADHSWLQDIYVADNNEVYLTQKHFYDELNAKAEVMYQGITNKKRNLAQVLTKFVHSFNSYYILNSYAKKNNVKIINVTEGSFIDAFERKQI